MPFLSLRQSSSVGFLSESLGSQAVIVKHSATDVIAQITRFIIFLISTRKEGPRTLVPGPSRHGQPVDGYCGSLLHRSALTTVNHSLGQSSIVRTFTSLDDSKFLGTCVRAERLTTEDRWTLILRGSTASTFAMVIDS